MATKRKAAAAAKKKRPVPAAFIANEKRMKAGKPLVSGKKGVK